MHLKSLKKHLSKYLLLYVIVCMGAGIGAGYPAAGYVADHKGVFTILTTIAVFFIIYPMMINLKLDSLQLAVKNWRGIFLALVYNFVLAPLFGYFLARGFLHDQQLAMGFLLVMVVPCSSMSIGYTGLAEGNVELATVVMAASFIFSIFAVPAWMSLFAAQYHMLSPTWVLIKSMLTVLAAPMIAGYLTRLGLIRRLGERRFMQLLPFFPSLSLIAMYGIVFLIFFMKATLIVHKWELVVWLTIPNTLFIGIALLLITWIDRSIRLSYADHMAIVFASTGKNNGTAIALATMAFSPMVAIPAATLPIFQILLLVLYLKAAPLVRRYFAAEHEENERKDEAKGTAHVPRSRREHECS